MGALIYILILLAVYYSLPWFLKRMDSDEDDLLEGWSMIGVKFLVGLLWPLALPVLLLFLITDAVIRFTTNNEPPKWL